MYGVYTVLSVCTQIVCCSLQKELLDIRELVDRGDNVERLGRKLAGIKRERVSLVRQSKGMLTAIDR